jgi:exopolyphosphatase/guanosine-5'-triphosphate,3'-diphosphate pyrophosphatase
VGGGSTEIVLSSGEVIERVVPLHLGGVTLSEQFGKGDILSTDEYHRMRDAVRLEIRRHVGKRPFVPQLAVGTGGTFTSLATMSMHAGTRGRDANVLPFAVRGYEMQRSEVKHFLDRLRKLPVRDRARVPGLNPDRADIIVAGLTIVDCVLKHLAVNRLRVHDQGIRSGLIHTMLDELYPRDERDRPTIDRMRSVHRFATSCQHERRHADHVTVLALQLFDELAAQVSGSSEPWTSRESRELLEAASLLHDVGYLIDYSKHHKHSFHLIMHARLPGFTHREREIIANIARYHRGACPKSKHANFARLDPADQALVRRLASILRLAVGLDRSHAQKVQGLTVQCSNGLAVIVARADQEPTVEIWGAERKSDLFKSTFGLDVGLRWSAPVADGRDGKP